MRALLLSLLLASMTTGCVFNDGSHGGSGTGVDPLRTLDLGADSGDSCEEGEACDDGDGCTSDDLCRGGVCSGTRVSCGECSSCDPSTGACAPDDSATCTLGDVACGAAACVGGECVIVPDEGSCYIEGACYSEGDGNGDNPCELCSGAQPTTWSVAAASLCDDDNECTVGDQCNDMGMCSPGQPAVGQPCDVQDSNPCTEKRCTAAGGCELTMIDDGTACEELGMTGACLNGICLEGACVIDGRSYNPDVPRDCCSVCDPSRDPGGWSPTGRACGPGGEVCTASLTCCPPDSPGCGVAPPSVCN